MAKRIGLQDLYAFPITKESESGVPTYGTPFRVAKAIEVNLQKNVAEAKMYADDVLDEYVSEVTGMTLTMNINELTPEIEAKLLGLTVDQLGGVSNGMDANAPYFAVVFRSKLSNGGYQYRVLYKVRFKPTDETFKTKGENIEFQQPTITGEATVRQDLGIFDYALDNSTPERKAVTEKWFTEIQVPTSNA
ncbi:MULTISPECIES: major tail protein [unclassified Granulicatella]|uniref:major tail protein n=1 Tax=unclassified Granulicatella TaxID=2630493 RepID=UPI00107459EC|nr:MULTISPECIES: major tail protein [unclassified Granulicatella]MBF0780513.1 phage tail protein [Granulicatella sp. 19428wC4_WM01]TFU95328.1 phage tail protein [Granulicatella sp. WM01]